LQFSSEEEMEEIPMEENVWTGEALEQQDEQAAMAMVQLGNISYYSDQADLVKVEGWYCLFFDLTMQGLHLLYLMLTVAENPSVIRLTRFSQVLGNFQQTYDEVKQL